LPDERGGGKGEKKGKVRARHAKRLRFGQEWAQSKKERARSFMRKQSDKVKTQWNAA